MFLQTFPLSVLWLFLNSWKNGAKKKNAVQIPGDEERTRSLPKL